MVLDDRSIMDAVLTGRIEIAPFSAKFLAPASYDVHMGEQILVCTADQPLDPYNLEAASWKEVHLIPGHAYELSPKTFVLVSTVERIKLGNDIAALLDGTSTLSRSGLAVHQTGQWIDPGFEGYLALEVRCNNPVGYMLRSSMRIGQLVFLETRQACAHPYAGRYQGQTGPVPPRTNRDSIPHELKLMGWGVKHGEDSLPRRA